MNSISLDQIKEQLDFFNKMYDAVRLVDPEYKRVIDHRGPLLSGTPEVCYDYWGNGKICDNCISIRASMEDRSFVKLESTEGTVFLVTAIPVQNAGGPVVLELLKNATDTMLIGSGDYNEGQLFHRFVRELNDMIAKDPMTCLYNRRFAEERLPVDVIDATLKHLPLSLCFIDLNDLKSINDLYGHGAGDRAIKAAAAMISAHIQPGRDWAARYGGGEFILCLNGTGGQEARLIAERIQNGIEKTPLDFYADGAFLSVSWGIETMDEIPMTAGELIRRADQKMYRSKRDKAAAGT